MLDVGDGVCLARESRLATGVGRVGCRRMPSSRGDMHA
jgi:hypothetical protein